jgi:hypothetical protein
MRFKRNSWDFRRMSETTFVMALATCVALLRSVTTGVVVGSWRGAVSLVGGAGFFVVNS